MSGPVQHGGGLAKAIALYGGSTDGWLDLSTGINPCPPPLPAIAPAAWHRLPDADLLARAEHAASRFYRTGKHRPRAVPGTQAVIQQVPGLAAAGRPVAILGPTYGEYQRVLELAGFAVDLVSSLAEIRPEHGLAIVVNPNNPTGRALPRPALLAMAGEMAATGGHLLVDEAFADGMPEESVAADAFTEKGLVVFRSFGKFFGYAGLRLGFVMAPPPVLDPISGALGPWAVSGPALAVAESLLSADTAAIRERIRERKSGLTHALREAGLKEIGGTDLFSLVEHPDAAALHQALCRQHVLTRAFDYAPAWLRIGLAPDEAADARLMHALRKALS
jgi:cobalamin biosynthetic protein CobC